MKANTNYNNIGSALHNILSADQCAEIYLAAQEVLEKTGVTYYDGEALDILKKAGCFAEENQVRIPSSLVSRALGTVPHKVVLCNSRTGSGKVLLESGKAYFGTGSDTPFYIDPFSGERKRSTIESVGWACKVIDALPNLDFVMSLGTMKNVPFFISDRYQFGIQILNTAKPVITTAHNTYGLGDIIEICEIIAGGEEELRMNPIMTLYAKPILPLQHDWEATSNLILAARKALPVIFTPCIKGDATILATMSEVLVKALAEILSGLVLHQNTREGAPFIMGGVFTVMDMASTVFTYGSPEYNLLMSAFADLAHYLKLPMFGTAGCSDSNIPDQQAGLEAALSITRTALSGPNLNHDVGYVEYGSTVSLDLVTMCNDIIGMARRFVTGIKIDEDRLGLDLIKQTGPGGSYKEVEHTHKYIPHEHWKPDIFNRQTFLEWESKGGKTLTEAANEKVRNIIEFYQPEPLPQDTQKKIWDVVARADSNPKNRKLG